MMTREIPRDEWTSFFDRLSRMHLDEEIRVEVLRGDIGAQLEVTALPLDGITADLKAGESSIAIAAGRTLDDHVTHIISDPVHVRVLEGPAGDAEVLEIEGADASTTLLFFEGSTGWPASRVHG